MSAESDRLDREFTRGEDYDLELTFTRPVDDDDPDGDTEPIDYTGFTFAAQLRPYEDYPTPIAFTVDLTDIATGVAVFSLAKEVTAVMAGEYAFDLRITDTNGKVAYALPGTFTVDKNVTRGA